LVDQLRGARFQLIPTGIVKKNRKVIVTAGGNNKTGG
jgi:hypothetical protein